MLAQARGRSSWIRRYTAAWAAAARHLGALAVLKYSGIIPTCMAVLVSAIFGSQALDEKNDIHCLYMAWIILIVALAGVWTGDVRSRWIDPWFNRLNFGHAFSQLDQTRFTIRNEAFISVSYFAVCFYVLFYYFVISRFQTPAGGGGYPLSWPIVGFTGGTIAAQMFFTVRYASYVKMAAVVGLQLASRATFTANDMQLLHKLNGASFRDEQLYEPAGNLFVTLGIMATFLGLAMGLVTLDLRSIAEGGSIASLSSFIGCMGLALGASMLGVLIALWSQWLRGFGPSEPTEELLGRSRRTVDAATASIGGIPPHGAPPVPPASGTPPAAGVGP